jgi:hypothetical protein
MEQRHQLLLMDLLGKIYHPNEKDNVIADCLENQFRPHYLYDENNKRRVENIESKLCSRM